MTPCKVACCFFLTGFDADIKESDNIASLHKQIAACDTILEVCISLALPFASNQEENRSFVYT